MMSVSHGGPWEPEVKCYIVTNIRETQRKPQFLSGVAFCVNLELQKPAGAATFIHVIEITLIFYDHFSFHCDLYASLRPIEQSIEGVMVLA